MSVCYTVYTEPTKPLLIEKIKDIIPGCEITVSETIIKISGIYDSKFTEIAMCFPFKSARPFKTEEDYALAKKDDSILTKEEKEIITAFFAETDFIIVRNNCLFSVDLFTDKDDNNDGRYFDDSKFLFWDDNTNIVKEDIESYFKDANVDFETFLKIF